MELTNEFVALALTLLTLGFGGLFIYVRRNGAAIAAKVGPSVEAWVETWPTELKQVLQDAAAIGAAYAEANDLNGQFEDLAEDVEAKIEAKMLEAVDIASAYIELQFPGLDVPEVLIKGIIEKYLFEHGNELVKG